MASPLDERTVGNAPYEEALAKAQARNLRGGGIHLSNIIERLGQRQRLLAALSGLGSFRQNEPLGANILNVLGGVGKARIALDQQASLDKYRAQQQAEADRKAVAEKPTPPPDPLLDLKRQHLQARIETEQARAQQLRTPKPPKPKAQTAYEKNAPAREAERKRKKREQEFAKLQGITDLGWLSKIAEDMSLEPETRNAARSRLDRYIHPQNPSQVR